MINIAGALVRKVPLLYVLDRMAELVRGRFAEVNRKRLLKGTYLSAAFALVVLK